MASTSEAPEGIFTLLDTDLYKLTMQCAILKHYPKVPVAYALTNRTPQMQLTRSAYRWLQKQISKLGDITVTKEEVEWLRKTCPYLCKEYLEYLEGFRLRPDEHVEMNFTPFEDGNDRNDMTGDLELKVKGLWVETILYEIPLLALVSEAYFKYVDRGWNHDSQAKRAKDKGLKLLENGCVFSEFGSRRRRDYHNHDLVMQGLVEATKEAKQEWKGKFTGTSNVHLAMKHGLTPIGTVAHEWFMAIAAITDDYASANEVALAQWTATFGRGVLAIALTDTFGTSPNFLKAFSKPAPKSGGPTDGGTEGKDPTFAQIFTGVRQDSGDPLEYVKVMKDYYTSHAITDKKVIVFSDSLNTDKCIQYRSAAEAAGLTASFGIGTFFTNDFYRPDSGKKSLPLNIVIKLSEADGRPAIKLSDNEGKNMGDSELVRKVKKEVGYEERMWKCGDEGHRWDK